MPKHEYYSRQTSLKDVGPMGQQKLSRARVLIVGAGGLGNPVATYLAAAGIGHLAILDFDKIELSNLNRQIFFTPNDVGNNKAEVLGERIKKQNPFVEVTSINEKLTQENASKIISEFDLIVDCCDNFATKFLIHDFAWFLKKNLVQASLYQYEGQIQSFLYSTNSEEGCLRCLWPKVPERDCTGSCQEAGLIGAVAGVLGTMQAMEVIKVILGIGEVFERVTTTVNLLTLSIDKIKWRKDADCPLCSAGNSIDDIKQTDYDQRKEFELEGLEIQKMELIDIREREEHLLLPPLAKAMLWPLSEVEQWQKELDEKKKYVLVCSKGIRSYRLAKKFRESRENIFSLFGGMERL